MQQPRWLGIAVLLLVVATVSGGWLLLPVTSWLDAFEHRISELGVAGVALFALIYLLATVSLAPEWPLTIIAGLLYGIWGFPLAVVVATVAASLAFLVARHLARERVRALFERRRRFAAIDTAVAEEGWKIVALLRLSPLVPFNLQNYLFGVTAIPFWHFVAATFAGIIPGAAFYVYLGVLGRAAGNGSGSGGLFKWALFGTGLLATAIVVVLVARRAATKLAGAGVGDR